MASVGRVRVKDIFTMLDACLPGHSRRESKHYWRITAGTRTFATLPLGEHGKGLNAEIEVGWVRKLVRFFDIADCAAGNLELLR